MTSARIFRALAAIAGAALATHRAVAQDVTPSVTTAAKDILPRYVVPESPAATFLSASPAEATRPGSAKDLAAALINAIDTRGRLQQGLALEAAYTRLTGEVIALGEYQRNPLRFALANTQLSVSSVRTSGDSASTDIAAGVRTTLFDRSDPLASLAFMRDLAAASKPCIPESPPMQSDSLHFFRGDTAVPMERAVRQVDSARVAALASARLTTKRDGVLKCTAEKLDSLKKDFLDKHWNDVSAVLAYAQGWRLDQSRVAEHRDRGNKLWGTASLPLGRRAQLIAYGDWSRGVAQDSVPAYTTVGYGGRLVVGAPDFHFFAERRRERRSREAAGLARRVDPWAGGLEFRIAPELWISAGLGANADTDADPKSGTVVLANLRWALSDRPRIK